MKDGAVHTADSTKFNQTTYAVSVCSLVLTFFCFCCVCFAGIGSAGAVAAAGVCILAVSLLTFNIVILVDYTLRVNEIDNGISQTETEYSKKMGEIFACTGYSVKVAKAANDLK